MKKFITLLSFALLCVTSGYGMDAKFVPANENETRLEEMFNQQSKKFQNWLDKYSIEEVQKLCKEISSNYTTIFLNSVIQNFIQYPVQEQIIQLKKHDLSHLKTALKIIEPFYINHILCAIMDEAFIYFKQQEDQGINKSYFNQLIQRLKELKQELRKPI